MHWDKGLAFDSATKLLLHYYRYKCRTSKCKCYVLTLLVQLRNGSRISEAVRAVKEFYKTRELKTEITASRSKRTRLMVYPVEWLDPGEIDYCVDAVNRDEKTLSKYIRNWCRSKLGINTHTLRCSFIKHLLRNGVEPLLVAKIIQHSKPLAGVKP